MSRSKWKVPFVSKKINKVVYLLSYKGIIPSVRNVWDRKSIIPTELIGSGILIHKGKPSEEKFPFIITPTRVGHKFGEFSVTKSLGSAIHSNNKLERKQRKKQGQLLLQKQRRKHKKKTNQPVRTKKT